MVATEGQRGLYITDGGDAGISGFSEVLQGDERRIRLEGINRTLETHGLANPYTDASLGNVEKDPTTLEVMGIQEVVALGPDMALVHTPVKLKADKKDDDGNLVETGPTAPFWTFYRTQEATGRNDMFIPIVTDAPGELPTPSDIGHQDPNIEKINEMIRDLNEKEGTGIRPLRNSVNQAGERVVGISDIKTENKRFFTVLILKVQKPNGEIVEEPYSFNTNSISGIDGVVFSPIIRAAHFGYEPRVVLGSAWRMQTGGHELEVARGFYDPRHGGRDKFRAGFTNVPAFKRAAEEAMDEMGIFAADAMKTAGKIRQDASFDGSENDYYNLDLTAENFGRQDLEDTERFSQQYISLGEWFAKLPEIRDPFGITAIGRDLLERGALTISDRGMRSQTDGERMAFQRVFRPQFGESFVEVMRGNMNDQNVQVDYSHGAIPANSGIARILQQGYYGVASWSDFKAGKTESDLQRTVLMGGSEALRAVQDGKFDALTATMVLKTMHARGHLSLQMGKLF